MRESMKRFMKSFGETVLCVLAGIIIWPFAIVWHVLLAVTFPVRFTLETKE